MAKKDINIGDNKNVNGSLHLGEIGTIRNILMGEQISEYELKFRDLEAQLNELKNELSVYKNNIENRNQQLIASFENNVNKVEQDLASLNKDFKQSLSELEQKIMQKMDERLNENQESFGKLLIQLGKELSDH